MKEFRLGQRVKIVHEDVAYNCFIEQLLGEEFTVYKLSRVGTGNAEAVFDIRVHPYYIPPSACELVEESTNNNPVKEAANLLQQVCHTASYNAGWWHDAEGNPTKDNPLTFSNKLMLVVSEIAEAMEGDRKDCMDDKLLHRKMAEVELADAVIRIMDLSGAYGWDIGGAIVEKMEFNKSRMDHSKESRESVGGKKY